MVSFAGGKTASSTPFATCLNAFDLSVLVRHPSAVAKLYGTGVSAYDNNFDTVQTVGQMISLVACIVLLCYYF